MSERYDIAQHAVVAEVAAALATVDGDQVERLCDLVVNADQVFFIGVGRVLLALEAIAKRLAHLGVRTVVVGQITEPAITPADLLIVGSGSGETAVPLAIAEKAKQLGVTVAHIGSNPSSSMNSYSDHFVRIPTQSRRALPDEVPSVQPMTSLFEQCLLLLGDVIALMMVTQRDIRLPDLWRHHANLE